MSLLMVLAMIIILIIVAGFFLIAIKMSGSDKSDSDDTEMSPVTAKPLLSVAEKLFYDAIKDAVPDHEVLIKVSLGSLLKSSSQGMRNQYNRRTALFVVIDQKTNVIVIIDVISKPSKDEVEKNAKTDTILLSAGYKLLRYDQIPMQVVLKEEIMN